MTDVHLLDMGQSNALGYLNDGPAPYAPTARVQLWVADANTPTGGEWQFMNPGVNTGAAGDPKAWGPEVAEANAFLTDPRHAGDVLWIFKSAPGSTALDTAGAALNGRTWSPEVAGNVYDHAVAGAQAAQHALDGTQYAFGSWDALMWSQGETDAADKAMAAHYGANLADLIAHVRADLPVYDVVVSRIDDGPGAGAWNLDVRQAEWAQAQQPGVAGFSTVGYGLAADGMHYDAAGQTQLGATLWNTWEAMA